MLNNPVLILPTEIPAGEIPRRSYDFNKGDRRFLDQADAIEWSQTKAEETGIRRVVRVDSTPDFLDGPFFISQEIGS